jgi:hypothetical protein
MSHSWEDRPHITARDGKELPLDLTLDMTREALVTWAQADPTDWQPTKPEAVHGMALALEAALLKVVEQADQIRALEQKWARSSRRCVGCGYCCQATPVEQRGEAHRRVCQP